MRTEIALDDIAEEGATRLTRTSGVTSVAVGVVASGARAYGRGFGASTGTAFRIASITKTMTAIGLMQQVEAGLVTIDDAVNDHLRSVRVVPPPGGAPVTIRHLLTHTAGVGELLRVGDLRRPYAGFAVRRGADVPPLRTVYEPEVRPAGRAGAKFAYANHGFGLLGVVLEDVSGDDYGAYIRERVLDPLGMTSTDVSRTARVGSDVAVGRRPRGARDAWDLDLTVAPAGGAWSSVDDLQLYAAALVSGGANVHGRVLQPATLASMLSPQYRLDPRLPARGLCFSLGDLGGHRLAGHDGGLPGFSSSLLVAPDDGAAAVVLANANSLEVSALVHRLALDMLRAVLGVADPVAEVARTSGPERPDTWPGLEGVYVPERGVLTSTRAWRGNGPVVVRRHAGALSLRAAYGAYRPGVRLVPDGADPDAFAVVSRGLVGRVVFVRGLDGRAAYVCIADDTGQHRLRRWRR